MFFLNESKNVKVTNSDLLEDIYQDQVSISEAENDFNVIMMEAMRSEAMTLNEADDDKKKKGAWKSIKEFFQKVYKWIVDLAKKVATFFKDIFTKLAAKAGNTQKFVEKNKDKIDKGMKLLSKEDKTMKNHKGAFDVLEKVNNKDIKAIESGLEKAEKIANENAVLSSYKADVSYISKLVKALPHQYKALKKEMDAAESTAKAGLALSNTADEARRQEVADLKEETTERNKLVRANRSRMNAMIKHGNSYLTAVGVVIRKAVAAGKKADKED